MTNHAEELNHLIGLAANRPDFQQQGYLSTENNFSKLNDPSVNLMFTCSVMGMEAISHVIEDQAINTRGNWRFYSAFQKFSRMKPQEERYRRLVSQGNPVYIFGQADYLPFSAANLHQINLDLGDRQANEHLAHNWFVVLYNPSLVSMALVARELPANFRPTGAPDKLVYRNFEGFWTYNPDMIGRVVDILDDFIRRQNGAVVS
ncbi:MAG TPA: DICT sensory domain-containing protein [Chloroflexia bacterium]|nr:DICT sensory domain-containing protein [Chloroflexia bacterium]